MLNCVEHEKSFIASGPDLFSQSIEHGDVHVNK